MIRKVERTYFRDMLPGNDVGFVLEMSPLKTSCECCDEEGKQYGETGDNKNEATSSTKNFPR